MRIKAWLQPTFESWGWLAVAIALTIGLETTIAMRAVSVNVDGLMFIDLAKKLESDPLRMMRANDQHPGYPALLLATEKTLEFVGFPASPELWTNAARLASAVCGVLSVIAMWLFAQALFGRSVGSISALSMAALPIFRMNASDALSDTPHIVLYLLSAWCAARGFATSRAAWWGGCGALGGLAFWVRPEGLEAPLAGGFLLVAALVLRLAPPRATLRSVGALAGGVAVLLLPYVFLAGKFTSKQLPFAKREAAPMYVVTESQAAARPPADAAIAPVAPAKAVVSPRVAMRVASKGTVTFVKNMVWGFRFAFLPMYLLGNWEMLRRRVPRWTIALAACIGGLHIGVLYMVFFISGYIDQRHVMECVAIALPFAALGIFYTSEIIHRFVLRSVPQASIAAAVTFLACATVTPRGLMPMNIDLQPAFDSAAWIRERARPGDAVISNTPYVPFFGELPWARLEPKVASIEAAIADGPADVRYNFAVLDLEIEGFKELWRVQIEREFAEVLRLSSPIPGTPSPKLIVYQRRPDAELRVGAASSGAKH